MLKIVSPQDLDERTLVQRAIARDKEAFGALYDRHVVRVYRHLYYMVGNTAEADRFDELAKIALRRQISYEGQAKTLETQAAQQTVLADKLKDGLNKLRVKREELVQRRDELVARAKMAQAQAQVQKTMKSVSVMDPTSELARFEEGIRRQEAQVRGMEEVSAASLEDQFASLESAEDEQEVDARLATLKSGG